MCCSGVINCVPRVNVPPNESLITCVHTCVYYTHVQHNPCVETCPELKNMKVSTVQILPPYLKYPSLLCLFQSIFPETNENEFFFKGLEI